MAWNSMRLMSGICIVLFLGVATACFKPGPAVTQAPVSISISSENTSLTIGQSATIDATIYDQSGSGVTWSSSPLNFGGLSDQQFDSSTFTASVLYTAPKGVVNPTTVTITATSVSNPNISKSISFHFSPITVAIELANTGLPFAPETLNPGDQIPLLSSVANDLSNLGVTWSINPANVGSLNVSGTTVATYIAPANVSAPTAVSVLATSAKDPSVTATAQFTILPSGGGPNVVTLNVNGGPLPGQIRTNGAFTSVTICNPGSATACQTVDGILVDTGSYGLRILQSQIPLLQLPTITDALGNTLENCANFPDGSFLWGAVARADIYIGGESASSLTGVSPLIQLIGNTSVIVPDGCSNGGVFNTTTPQLLGANGILGIGPEPTDCTIAGVNYCDGSKQPTPPDVYYSCPSTGCTTSDSPVLVNALLQVSNPISLFSGDKNGVIIQLPAISGPQAEVAGTMVFGIGTELNNALGTAAIYTLDENDHFTTVLNSQNLSSSFIDSASEANFFPYSFTTCTAHTNLYCPATTTNLRAALQGATQGSSTVAFNVDNADSLLSSNSQDAAFGTLAGPVANSSACQGGSACVFDWGIPFFYGRPVFEAIDGQSPPSGAPAPPWWAF